jgi:hypothetical protein
MGLTGVLGCGLLDREAGGGTRARAELGPVAELPDKVRRAILETSGEVSFIPKSGS